MVLQPFDTFLNKLMVGDQGALDRVLVSVSAVEGDSEHALGVSLFFPQVPPLITRGIENVAKSCFWESKEWTTKF